MNDTTATYSTLTDGRAATVTAGTRVQFTATVTQARVVKIKAFADNTDKVVVGGSAVVAALGTRKGIELAPGESVDIRVDDVSKLYIDSVVSGEGIGYVAFNG